MVSSTFRSAVSQATAEEDKTSKTRAEGFKDIVSIFAAALGGAGILKGAAGQMAKGAAVSRISGVGGAIMASSIEEKKATAIQSQGREALLFSPEEFEMITTKTLEGNRINAHAMKQMGTVFEVLKLAKEAKEANKNAVN